MAKHAKAAKRKRAGTKRKAPVRPAAAPRASSAGPRNGDDTLDAVERLLYRQADLLDGKDWQGFIDLFADDGVYWMPASPEQTTGDGVLASFDSAERAVRAAIALREVARSLDLRIRAGVHSGEVQVTADDVRGIAVHTAARIMAVAGPDEILVSATVMDLVDGSDLGFEDAGKHELKGFRGTRQLFRSIDRHPVD